MLFKEKLLLSNCDSVKQIKESEIKKRILLGLTFSDGIILMPNTLIDNSEIGNIISAKNISRYLNEEGHGKFIIRGFGIEKDQPILDYFESLPSDFILSSLPGSPTKANLSNNQKKAIRTRILSVQKALDGFYYKIDTLNPSRLLQSEILSRIKNEISINLYFLNLDDRNRFVEEALSKNIISRSQWYKFTDNYFSKSKKNLPNKFKLEIIDPSYNYLYVKNGEGFLQDNISIFNKIPTLLLDSTVNILSFRNEIDYIKEVYDTFETISSFGAKDLIDIVTDKAMDFIEDKALHKGKTELNRKNWFGMYNVLTEKIGLEIK